MTPIDYVHEFKYLGVRLDSNFSSWQIDVFAKRRDIFNQTDAGSQSSISLDNLCLVCFDYCASVPSGVDARTVNMIQVA